MASATWARTLCVITGPATAKDREGNRTRLRFIMTSFRLVFAPAVRCKAVNQIAIEIDLIIDNWINQNNKFNCPLIAINLCLFHASIPNRIASRLAREIRARRRPSRWNRNALRCYCYYAISLITEHTATRGRKSAAIMSASLSALPPRSPLCLAALRRCILSD